MKTKLGISVGILGAIVYLAGLWGGLLALLVTAGYVLIAEENEWLRKTAVKAVMLFFSFAVVSVLIGLIPDLLGLLNRFIFIFDGEGIHINFIDNLWSFIDELWGLVRVFVFLIFAALAVKQSTIKLPGIDNFINKHMGTK